VPVALLYQSVAQSQHVRETLVAIGTPIAYEATAAALDREALARSSANVVVVNLEDEDDPGLDAVYALLDDPRYTVIFNDSGVSSELSGWDQARWVRHLAAKVFGGDADLDPPRPAGAEPVPPRAKTHMTDAPAAVDTPPVDVPAVMASEPVEQAPATQAPAFDPTEFIDLLHDAAPSDPLMASHEKVLPAIDIEGSTGEDVELVDIDDLLADFEAKAPEPLVEVDSVDEFVVDIAPEDLPVAAGIRPPEQATESPAATDLPAGFDLDFDLDDVAADTPPAPAPAKAIGGLADSWSLEDIADEAAPIPVPTGPAQFGIEKVSASEYLAPEGGDEAEQPPMPSLSELALELIPLEEAVSPTRETLDHENWFDPDSIKAKIQRVWVLGASVGGPESVREFLAEFPRDYPALFLLAQHLGDEFVDMMAKQLGRATQMTVRTPAHGERVSHGEIVIVPNAQRLQVDPMGVVLLEKDASEAAYRPSIDRVIEDVANRYGANGGAIVFSGMSDDAVAGCRYLVEKGGKVYAQSPESCVVSTMVDGVNEAGLVSFEGTPKELAAKLLAERT
jgi:two-component system chemotaxis response regulator CheB/chemosensory pili system protein ChpB (putative protein-glutamate methylesterase)